MPIVTRRSASASSRTSGSSSSSGSSSASSSSSSSSGSGSDSSSSDTEASRASSQSRTSRVSRSSQKSATTTTTAPTTTQKVTQKKQATVSKATTVSKAATTTSKKSAPSTSAPTTTNNSNTTTTNKNRTSGTVTNAKTIPRIKGQVTKNVKRKAFIASSSESESTAVVSTAIIKKVGSKPPATSTIITNKKLPSTVKTPVKRKKQPPSVQTNTKATSNNKRSTTANNDAKQSGSTAVQRKLMKSIFSPDNSSEDSDFDSKPNSKRSTVVNGTSKSNSKLANSNNISASNTTTKTTNNKKKANVKNKKSTVSIASTNYDKQSVSTPQSKFASSTSLSASATSSASSSCSSSDSSSDAEDVNVEKKPPSVHNSDGGKHDSSPSASAPRKRPVTRRQRRTIKSKTIPTTTTFNQSALTQLHSQSSGCWDSDFSDEPKSLARVPAKSSQPKSRLKPPEEDEEEKERKCPFPCCDSSGHLSGNFPTHSMLTTCPKYHGFSPEECKENADERQKRETERRKYYVPNQPHHKKPAKLSQDAKAWIARTKELKARNTADGLCSEYDLSLWNDALALAAGRVETEQGESLSYRSVAMGRWEMSCWCASPYPEPLCHCRRLFICEFCLKPVQSGTVLRRHCAKCVWRHPPGDEIYRKERLSVWEVDGKTQKTYCQNLCLLAKCFLDHKTLYLDVDPFLFYVMTLADSTGCHIVGYFSKEKNQSFLNYNVSCILTLPPYQRQGFGRLLIDFSYLLTRVEGKVGSPEKPLSDLGLISYRSYWKDAVLRRMCACASREMNVKDLSIELGVTSADLISTLQFLGMLKYWKGKHLVLKKQDVLEEYLERVRRREQRTIDSSCLRWRPWNNPAP